MQTRARDRRLLPAKDLIFPGRRQIPFFIPCEFLLFLAAEPHLLYFHRQWWKGTLGLQEEKRQNPPAKGPCRSYLEPPQYSLDVEETVAGEEKAAPLGKASRADDCGPLGVRIRIPTNPWKNTKKATTGRASARPLLCADGGASAPVPMESPPKASLLLRTIPWRRAYGPETTARFCATTTTTTARIRFICQLRRNGDGTYKNQRNPVAVGPT